MAEIQNLAIEEKLKSMLCINTSKPMVHGIKNEIDISGSENIDHLYTLDVRRHQGSHSSETNSIYDSKITNSTKPKYSNKRKQHQTEKYNNRNKIRSSNCNYNKKQNITLLEENSTAILNEQNILDIKYQNNSKINDNLMINNQFKILNINQNKQKFSEKKLLNQTAFNELSVNNESQTKILETKNTDSNNKYVDTFSKNALKRENNFVIDHSNILKCENVFQEDDIFGINLKPPKIHENPINVDEQFNNQKKHIDSNITTHNPIIEEELEKHGMFLLKKKNPRFPKAKFFCRVCNYHLDNVDICFRHSKESTHMHHFNAKKEREIIENIGELSFEHEQAVTLLLEELFSQIYPTSYQLSERILIFNKINDIALKFDVSAKLYGSSQMLFATNESDINISIETNTPSCTLINFEKYLMADQTGCYVDIISDFSSKMPKIYLKIVPYTYRIVLTISYEGMIEMANLLRFYAMINENALKIIVIFKHWAKICRIDNQIEGMLSPYAFTLMAIYYLQQHHILPVLNEIFSEDELSNIKHGEMYNFNKLLSWKIVDVSLCRLWLDLLKFYTIDFDIENIYISIVSSSKVSKANHNLTNKRFAIEDPGNTKRNVARSLCQSQSNDYIITLLTNTYKYFGIQQPNLQYHFDNKYLLTSPPPRPLCNICLKYGHTKSNCQEENIPNMIPLPILTPQYLKKIDEFINHIYYEYEPGDKERNDKTKLLAELESFIKKSYPNSKLVLFGSQCNGFSFKNSDMDISMIIKKKKVPTATLR